MKFRSYSEIESIERTAFLQKIEEEGKSGGEWVVGEKIHGANFSFWVADDEIRCASRNDFIGENTQFYNWKDVLEEHADRLRLIYNNVKETYPNVNVVTIYGELFGGSYTHPDVEKTYMAMRVQKGVFYHPGNKFMAFDMVLRSDEHNVVMPHDYTYDTCNMFGLPHVPVLLRGTMQECIIYPNDGTSKVHSYFGLPEIADNIMEGVVIKPVTPAFFFNRERIIIKNKNDIFKERARKKESVNPNKENRLDFEMSEDGKLMCVEVLTYVTENRLRNVLSKVQGGITHKMFGPLLGMFSKDVLADFMKDNAEEYSKLEDRERKRVTKAMSEVASTMLRENFVNIIDNNF